MRYEFIDRHRSMFSVEGMCRVLEVKRSGYYAWKRRGASMRQRGDRVLLERIRESYRQSKGRYGSPRVYQDLRGWGWRTSRKRVARLMREAGLSAKTKQKFKVTTMSKHTLPVADNLLMRDFSVPAPNRAWVRTLHISGPEGAGSIFA
jgi:transposase InsO family protein